MALTRLPRIVQQLYGTFVWQKPGNDTVHLTFDDGPHPTITPFVLSLLKEYNAQATFFCVGNNVSEYPEVFQAIIQGGHNVGNHTMNHINGWHTPIRNYIKEVLSADKLIGSKLFRPPYGRIKKRQANFLKKRGFSIIMWSLLTKDYDQSLSPLQCWENVSNNIKAGDIIVFHDSDKAYDRLKYCLPRLLAYCKENHLKMKSL